ncbi:MAG: hypothetical protein HYS32_04410 [Candidatus Woesearchaeota archaeon]|nr:MAG: hypothetical protein HYS32_04410 [Candidatus Woesearchaeota archaeon]
MYAVFRTAKFEKEVSKQLSKENIIRLENLEKKQLRMNPKVGDPLGFNFFREKRINGKRVYFLIYDDLKAVLMIGLSDKKTQQETIDIIKGNLGEYYNIIKEAIKRHGEYDYA